MSLFKFKAGQVQYDEETGEALPIRGQGLVVLKKSSEDPSLLAIQWQPRAAYGHTMTSGEELMVLPGDVEFEFVPECTTGRVVSMKFESSNKRTLYWLQEPAQGDLNFISDEDEAIVDRLNELANEPLDEDEDFVDDAGASADDMAVDAADVGDVEDVVAAAEAAREAEIARATALAEALAAPARAPDFSAAMARAYERSGPSSGSTIVPHIMNTLLRELPNERPRGQPREQPREQRPRPSTFAESLARVQAATLQDHRDLSALDIANERSKAESGARRAALAYQRDNASEGASGILARARAEGTRPLQTVFTLPVLTEHISNASDEEVARLLETVDVATTRQELLEVVRSPHFRQSLAQLSQALQMGGTAAVTAAAGIQYDGEGIEAFLRAVFKSKE